MSEEGLRPKNPESRSWNVVGAQDDEDDSYQMHQNRQKTRTKCTKIEEKKKMNPWLRIGTKGSMDPASIYPPNPALQNKLA